MTIGPGVRGAINLTPLNYNGAIIMTKQGRIQQHGGQWLDCEFSFSEAEAGYVLRILSPYRITLAVLKKSVASPEKLPQPQERQAISPPIIGDMPQTIREFMERAKNHNVLGRGSMWQAIIKDFSNAVDDEPEPEPEPDIAIVARNLIEPWHIGNLVNAGRPAYGAKSAVARALGYTQYGGSNTSRIDAILRGLVTSSTSTPVDVAKIAKKAA